MSTNLKISSYDTDAELYAALSRVFEETVGGNGTMRWVNFKHEGVEFTFFAPSEAKQS